MMMQRTDTLFRKVKGGYADALGHDVHVLVGCYSDWNDDVKYILTVAAQGQDFYRCKSWSPRAALKEALKALHEDNGGGSTLSIVRLDSATSERSGRN
jgi:hypothetical protein